jgi:hypothetical protein
LFCVLKIRNEFYKLETWNPMNGDSSGTETAEMAGASKILLAH